MQYTKTSIGFSSPPETIQEMVTLRIVDEGKNKTDIHVEGNAEMMAVSSPLTNKNRDEPIEILGSKIDIPSTSKSSSVDFSDANHWEIRQTDPPKYKSEGSRTISINRNTGVISYEDKFTVSRFGSSSGQITRGSGICSKVDTTKRKF
jgi:hypothetical protein